jgi:uncharacterized protein YceK
MRRLLVFLVAVLIAGCSGVGPATDPTPGKGGQESDASQATCY